MISRAESSRSSQEHRRAVAPRVDQRRQPGAAAEWSRRRNNCQVGAAAEQPGERLGRARGGRADARAEMNHRLPFHGRIGDEAQSALTLVGRRHDRAPDAEHAVFLVRIGEAREQTAHDLRLARGPVDRRVAGGLAPPHLRHEFAAAHDEIEQAVVDRVDHAAEFLERRHGAGRHALNLA
jgi:hypothetical protein